MREFKFKVWDKVKGAMFMPHAITFDAQSLAPFAVRVPGRSWEPKTKFKLLQWTGLSDKTGTEVYEGDLVEISSTVFRVDWSDSVAGFQLVKQGGNLTRAIADATKGAVIGNCFQNVECSNISHR